MKKRLSLLLIFCGTLLLLTSCGQERLEWPDHGLAAMLPAPPPGPGEITLDLDDTFSAALPNSSLEKFQDYVSKCVGMGFTIDPEESENEYRAYNTDGYEIWINFASYSDDLDITIYAPRFQAGETYVWPSIGLAALLPTPASSIGHISIDTSIQFTASIGETSLEAYSDYVDQCIEAGFQMNHSRSDKIFDADNADGVSLRIQYAGFNTMNISMYAPDEQQSEGPSEGVVSVESEPLPTVQGSAEDPSQSAIDDSAVRPEFKEAMDSYEAFFDEYIAFMEKYANSDGDLSLLTDYMQYMAQYAETMESLESIDENELTTAELLYYSEVMGRISQKLLSVSVTD